MADCVTHGAGTSCGCGVSPLGQDLAEVAFERSLCGAVAAGDAQRARALLTEDPSRAKQTSADGYTPLVRRGGREKKVSV